MKVMSLFRSGLMLGLAFSCVSFAQPVSLVSIMRLDRAGQSLRNSREVTDLIAENSRGPAGSQGPVLYLECVGLAEKARAVGEYTRRSGLVYRDEQDALRDMSRALIRDSEFVLQALDSLRPNNNRGWDSRGRWSVQGRVKDLVLDVRRSAQDLIDELRSGFGPGGGNGGGWPGGGGNNGGDIWPGGGNGRPGGPVGPGNGGGWPGGGPSRPPISEPLPVPRPERPDYVGYALVEADFDLYWDFTIHLAEGRLTPANGEEMRAAGVGNTTFRLSDNARVERGRDFSPNAPLRYELNVSNGRVDAQRLSEDGKTLFLRIMETGRGVGTVRVEVKFYQDGVGGRPGFRPR